MPLLITLRVIIRLWMTFATQMSRINSQGFPGGSHGKEAACNVEDLGSIPGLGRSPGGGYGNPLEYSCLGKPHGQRSLAGYSSWGHKELDTTEWLSTAQKKRKRNVWENISEDYSQKFPNMGKEIATEVQEAQRVTYRISQKKNTPRHILIKLTKSNKEKMQKAKINMRKNPYKSNSWFFKRNPVGQKGVARYF